VPHQFPYMSAGLHLQIGQKKFKILELEK
jgi:hypothetical protein